MKKVNDFVSHLENINWKYISLREPLSESFISAFQDYIDWRYLSVNERVSFSQEFLKKFENKLHMDKYLKRNKI